MCPGILREAPGPRLLALHLALLLGATQGLQVIPDSNCSQLGLQCRIQESSCLDVSWFHPYIWTPSGPSSLTLRAASRPDESGHTVPVLHINWTASVDASVRQLQGAEISIVEASTGSNRCVQLQFLNVFQSQRDENGQPWSFHYGNFQVEPGGIYDVTVQHLPKDTNNRSQRITVPDCKDTDMQMTHTCCQQGYCWTPNISLEVRVDQLIVSFTPDGDNTDYNVQVHLRDKQKFRQKVQQGALSGRLQVTFPSPVVYDPCLYKIKVWPNCTDCVRHIFHPTCSPVTTPEPYFGRSYFSAAAALVTLLVFAAIVIACYYIRDCIYTPGLKSIDLPPPPPPEPSRRKVWLVYSADHRRYVDAVIALAEFLRATWGMEVILDRLHVQDMSVTGAMAWLGRQKSAIEEAGGTVLVLCSRGTREKWEALMDRERPRVALRSDAHHQCGDLFTPALTLILPDFQRANPYERYVVAYFSRISDPGHVPSPLEICPKYALPEDLQALFFRIQGCEQYRPNVQLRVEGESNTAYGHLLEAMGRCRGWQEQHRDWYEAESSLCREPESSDDDGDGFGGCVRVRPLIRRPEVSPSVMTPLIVAPDPVLSLDPTIVVGPPVDHMDPVLHEPDSAVTVMQPLLSQSESFVLEPRLSDIVSPVEVSQPVLHHDQPVLHHDGAHHQPVLHHDGIHHQPVLHHDGAHHQPVLHDGALHQLVLYHDGIHHQPLLHCNAPLDLIPPMDFMAEAQKRFFYHSVLQSETPNPARGAAQPGDLHQTPRQTPPEDESEDHDMALAIHTLHPPQSGDQGYYTWKTTRDEVQALKDSAVRLFMRNGGVMDGS